MLKIYLLRRPQNSFEVTLKYKGVGVRVAFEGGNNYREIPAKCYTRDPFKQRAIEASQMFKDGEIALERTIEEESDRKKAAEAVKKPAGESQRENTLEVHGEGQGTQAEPLGEPAGTRQEGQGDAGDDGMEKKVFENLAEAILYIATTYQTQVQTANEARNFLKERGIKATIKQG